ncbi:MAG: hypothetical protein HUN05_06875 [Desulfobacter sp.]|nr:MAG: hypothetical protein HUN05_06875 [Desulfobacter sp.]
MGKTIKRLRPAGLTMAVLLFIFLLRPLPCPGQTVSDLPQAYQDRTQEVRMAISGPKSQETAPAEDDDFDILDPDLESGDQDPFAAADQAALDSALSQDLSPFHFGGYLEITSELGFNKPANRLSSLKPLVSLESEYKISQDHKLRADFRAWVETAYAFTAREDPGSWSQDDKKWDVSAWDFFLDSRLNEHFSLRLGNQIVAWGESNYAQVLDVVNPRDMTRPGLMELEDARLPVPDGVAFKAARSFNGGDLSLVASHVYDPCPILDYQGMTHGGTLVFVPVLERMTSIGVGASLVRDAALFKFETAFRKDRAVQRRDILDQIYSGLPQDQVETFALHDQIEALAGLEFSKINDLLLLAEVSCVHTLSHDQTLNQPENLYTSYFEAKYEMWHNTLSLDLFWVYFNPGDGHILRLSGEYDVYDNLKLEAGVAFYEARTAEALIYPYRDMDRLFCRLTWFF